MEVAVDTRYTCSFGSHITPALKIIPLGFEILLANHISNIKKNHTHLPADTAAPEWTQSAQGIPAQTPVSARSSFRARRKACTRPANILSV